MASTERAQAPIEAHLTNEARARRRRLGGAFDRAAASGQEALETALAMVEDLRRDPRYRPSPHADHTKDIPTHTTATATAADEVKGSTGEPLVQQDRGAMQMAPDSPCMCQRCVWLGTLDQAGLAATCPLCSAMVNPLRQKGLDNLRSYYRRMTKMGIRQKFTQQQWDVEQERLERFFEHIGQPL